LWSKSEPGALTTIDQAWLAVWDHGIVPMSVVPKLVSE
jgi:hypothetical protein